MPFSSIDEPKMVLPSPEIEAWAKPYVDRRWKFTALKVAKDPFDNSKKKVTAGALRMSFKSDKPVSTAGGMFAPVWVTGQLSVKGTKASLYLMDGASEVDAGYSLHASKVEPYEQ